MQISGWFIGIFLGSPQDPRPLGAARLLPGAGRSSYVITARVHWGAPPDRGLSRKNLLEGLRGSLRRLQLDYVDVVFAGPRPGPAHNEGTDPTLRLLRLEELVRAMSDVIEQGLALYWGTAGGAPGDVMDTFAGGREAAEPGGARVPVGGASARATPLPAPRPRRCHLGPARPRPH
uniref:NADP-dependent oxidoreductase domain-containing protein n=1 Tax=Geospiza parvula TaxID=87175 RepID=A0A8C3MLH7_GEOPR